MHCTQYLHRMILGALVTITLACCSEPQPYLSSDLFITNTNVLDVEQGSWLTNQTVIVRDETIFAIEPANQVSIPDSATVVHDGGYVIPGLWDMHVHATTDPDFATDYAFPLYIANGITGVRDMGSVVAGLVETRSRLAADPSLLAPELVAAGPLLDGVKLPWYGDLPLLLESVEDVEAKLPGLIEQGVDFFKVYDQLPADVYREVLRFAAANNIQVAGHPPRAVGITEAAMAGQRSIEHLSEFSFMDCVSDPGSWFTRSIETKFSGSTYDDYYQLLLDFHASWIPEQCDGAVAALANNQTYLTPTMVMELNDSSRTDTAALAYLEPGARDWCETGLGNIDGANGELREAVYTQHKDFLYRLHEAGIPLLAGSDNPNNCLVPGFSLHLELERLVEAGLSEIEALRTATVNAATWLGRESSEGRVAAGYKANLLVLSADPLQDISAAQQLAGVFSKGRWINETGLADQLEKAAAWVARPQ